MVHHLKYQEATHLAQILGKIMAANFDDINKIDMIVPVPLHKVRQRERGFNQSECISLVLSRILKIKLQSNILKRMSYTPTQTHLTAEERQNNLKDIFNLSDNSVKGKSILLVDDVITTGSTINACAKVFKSSGASQVFGCSIARPELRLMKESA